MLFQNYFFLNRFIIILKFKKKIEYNQDEDEIDNNDKENYYYAERININRKNGLKLGRKNSDDFRMLGFDIEAEDPRLICFQNKIYIIFVAISIFPLIEQRLMYIDTLLLMMQDKLNALIAYNNHDENYYEKKRIDWKDLFKIFGRDRFRKN